MTSWVNWLYQRVKGYSSHRRLKTVNNLLSSEYLNLQRLTIILFIYFFILSDINWNAEDYGFYKNEPEADIDDEKDDNEGEESNVLDLEKRSTDPESRKGRSRGSPFRPSVARALWRPRRRSGVRRRRRNG